MTLLIKNLAQKVWTFWQSAILIKTAVAVVFALVRYVILQFTFCTYIITLLLKFIMFYQKNFLKLG